MTNLIALTDYQGRFGFKTGTVPFRSGYDKGLLSKAFVENGFGITFVRAVDALANITKLKRQIVLSTSCDEVGNNYKGFLEDVVYALEEVGAIVVPRALFIRAHNNKVFMEAIRGVILGDDSGGLQTLCYGALDELHEDITTNRIRFPCVVKSAVGAMSRNVALARNARDLIRIAKRFSRTPHLWDEFKNAARKLKTPGYRGISGNQGKFIVQEFVPNLDGDWKVLVYGNHFYPLKRHVRPGDFRASGSHRDYCGGSDSNIPEQVLEFAHTVHTKLDTPNASFDICFDGSHCFLTEFQHTNFGTSVQADYCRDYYERDGINWKIKLKCMNEEQAFAWGIAYYLRAKAISS